MLKTFQLCGGKFDHPIWKIVLARAIRFFPMYFLMILFMWKVVPVLGGDGPRFYQFEDSHGCSESFIWQVLYLNNLIPWTQSSKCLEQTWYLANDL